MIELRKRLNGNGYDVITIKTDEGEFTISFEGNLDLYWICYSDDETFSFDNPATSKKFVITKENLYLYNSFNKLYNAIKNNKPYSNGININEEFKNKKIKLSPYMEDKNRLFKNNKIEWHSDYGEYENESYLTIEKNKDSFEVIFNKVSETLHLRCISINFCNSGSKYNPFNITFCNMYNELKNYNYDYHQIHIDEYLEDQKVLKKKR